MRTAADRTLPQSVVGRVLTLLTAFRPGDTELTLAELHRRTGIAKPTAHRLLAELDGWDVIERTPTGIRLGMRLFELGQLVPRQRGLLEAAAPFLTDLFEATHETVHLAVPDGVEVVYVQKLDGSRGPRVPSRVGGRMPMHCTGVGKALLAFGPSERLAAVLDAGLTRVAPRTIITPGRLNAELAAIRESGVSREREESGAGVTCVAAPVLGATGRRSPPSRSPGGSTGSTRTGWRRRCGRRRWGCRGCCAGGTTDRITALVLSVQPHTEGGGMTTLRSTSAARPTASPPASRGSTRTTRSRSAATTTPPTPTTGCCW